MTSHRVSSGTGDRRPRGMVSFEKVSKRFGPGGEAHRVICAVDSVDLRVEPGESVGIIGPNGAGKSTMLKLAAGVTAPSEGRVRRTGRTCSVIELGAGIHPDLTGRENITMLAGLYGLDSRSLATRSGEIVEFAELDEVIDRPARTYSTGMLARLSFSVAAHTDPDLLLLDEVLSVGDLAFQTRCRERLQTLRRAGVTLVVVSHALDLIAATCDRAILMVEGHVVADGRSENVIRRYVGLPESATTTQALEISAAPASGTDDRDLRVVVGPPAGTGAGARLRLDLICPRPPGTATSADDISIVCASTTLSAPRVTGEEISLSLAGLPGGRYVLEGVLEDDEGDAIARGSVPLDLEGPVGPFALRLDASLTVVADLAGHAP